jgi:hypothetical protein
MVKLFKYYSLDDCQNPEDVYSILNDLQGDDKIEYEVVEDMGVEVFKIKDIGLTTGELKKLISDFNKLDVIEYVMDEIEDDDDLDEYEEDIDNYSDEDEW